MGLSRSTVFQIRAGSWIKNPRKLAPWPDTLSCWVRLLFAKTYVAWPLKNLLWSPDSETYLEHCEHDFQTSQSHVLGTNTLPSFFPVKYANCRDKIEVASHWLKHGNLIWKVILVLNLVLIKLIYLKDPDYLFKQGIWSQSKCATRGSCTQPLHHHWWSNSRIKATSCPSKDIPETVNWWLVAQSQG